MKIIASLLISILACISFAGRAQTQTTGWLASFNTIKTGKHTSIHADLQWRSSDEWKHTQTLLVRGGFNYHVSKKIIVTGGYAFVHNRRVSSGIAGYINEHRIWEQVIYNHRLGPAYTSHRGRLEQRFIGKSRVVGNELETDGHAYANRVRYFIRNVLPFQKQAVFSKGLFAAVQNEVFLNVGNKANVNGKTFDQNRLYLALGYRIRPSADIEAGYLNQYISGVSGRTNNHVAQLALYLRI